MLPKPSFRWSEALTLFHCISIRSGGWNLTHPQAHLSPPSPKPFSISCQELILKYKQWRRVMGPSDPCNQNPDPGACSRDHICSLDAHMHCRSCKFRLGSVLFHLFCVGFFGSLTCVQVSLGHVHYWERLRGATEDRESGGAKWGLQSSIGPCGPAWGLAAGGSWQQLNPSLKGHAPCTVLSAGLHVGIRPLVFSSMGL